MKIVSTFTWPSTSTLAFVTDDGYVLIYDSVDGDLLLVNRYSICDKATRTPVVPARGLAPGSKINVLFVQGSEQVWKPFVVESIGTTTFQYRESMKVLGTLAYADEGKHWRLI